MKSAIKLMLLALIIFVSSCKKEESLAVKRLPLLTKAGWLTLKVEEKQTDGTWKDVTGTPPVTDADDLIIFYGDGAYELNEGPLRLPTDPQISLTGKWTFVDDGNKIQFIGTNLMEVLELSDTKLQTLITQYTPNQRYTFGHP